MLSTLERTLKTLKGEDSMESERKFKMIRFLPKPYEEGSKTALG